MVRHGAGSDRTADFHAHHAPVGALSSFTVGRFGAAGGPGSETTKPAGGGFTAGYRDGDGVLRLLPFTAMSDAERQRYVQGGAADGPVRAFAADEIRRDYGWCTDLFRAGDLELAIHTPLRDIADPASAPLAAQREAFAPAIIVRLTVRNPGTSPRDAVLAQNVDDRWLPLTGINGLRSRRGVLLAAAEADATAFINFDVRSEFSRTHGQALFGLGSTAGFRVVVPPGATRTVTLAIGWWIPGEVTIGRAMRSWYTRLFSGPEDVVGHALAHAEATIAACAARDAELASSALDDEQRFFIAHATRGYHASTQLLDDGGKPRWVVNEGEYLMLNTFDLTVDMMFHELCFHPWSLVDVLEQFASEYRYESRVFDPAEPTRLLPGGVAFSHDMGVHNVWSPAGRSSYEIEGLDRACFSHMSCEQLTNWVLCAGVAWARTRDAAFLARHAGLLAECQRSLLNRDHPEPGRRRGWMQCEDERCRGGGEITTYDSLDHSLGQSRANVYLAVKMWASHVALIELMTAAGRPDVAALSAEAARRGAAAIAAAPDPATGIIPALLEGGVRAGIIPAIEGLAYPHRMGLTAACSADGAYGAMIRALRRHAEAVLVDGVCLYADGGWKLSASIDNSWASKIALCQYVARAVLGVRQPPAAARRADRAHADWQRIGAADHAASDQFRAGRPIGSLSYPRLVTSVLWLDESGSTT